MFTLGLCVHGRLIPAPSSLQEISPLAHGFVGGYLLNPYLTPFREALNLAATGLVQQCQAESGPDPKPKPSLQRSTSTIPGIWRRQPDYPYKLVEARNVGMTAILLFARKPDAIHHIQTAECAFGIANMGNKGAVALRVTYSDAGTAAGGDGGEGLAGGEPSTAAGAPAERRTTELTFVATHLAAMEYNLRRRNANWATIVVCPASFLAVYTLPRSLLSHVWTITDQTYS